MSQQQQQQQQRRQHMLKHVLPAAPKVRLCLNQATLH
jgi:hypothetical protein